MVGIEEDMPLESGWSRDSRPLSANFSLSSYFFKGLKKTTLDKVKLLDNF